jgi:hypothetical protein
MKLRARPNLLVEDDEGEGKGTLLVEEPTPGEGNAEDDIDGDRSSLVCTGGVCAGLEDDEL